VRADGNRGEGPRRTEGKGRGGEYSREKRGGEYSREERRTEGKGSTQERRVLTGRERTEGEGRGEYSREERRTEGEGRGGEEGTQGLQYLCDVLPLRSRLGDCEWLGRMHREQKFPRREPANMRAWVRADACWTLLAGTRQSVKGEGGRGEGGKEEGRDGQRGYVRIALIVAIWNDGILARIEHDRQ
jgi:hypothetical protein